MEPVQIKLFTPKLLPRLEYIASIILGDILGLGWETVTDKDKLAGEEWRKVFESMLKEQQE